MKKDFIHLAKCSIRKANILSIGKLSEYSPVGNNYVICITALGGSNPELKIGYKEEKERDNEFSRIQKELDKR